jgi:hypothetical protein
MSLVILEFQNLSYLSFCFYVEIHYHIYVSWLTPSQISLNMGTGNWVTDGRTFIYVFRKIIWEWLKFPRLESKLGPWKYDFPIKWCQPVTHNFASRSCALDSPLHTDIRVAKFLNSLIWSISEFVSSYALPQTDSAFNVNIWRADNEEKASSPRTDSVPIKV